jgi:aspartate racemase
MTGAVYARALKLAGREAVIPDAPMRRLLNAAIFDELCQGVFEVQTTRLFLQAVQELQSQGAECVILGCTEIPLIVTAENSPLPVLDSTRLLARRGVQIALEAGPRTSAGGWLAAPGSEPGPHAGR